MVQPMSSYWKWRGPGFCFASNSVGKCVGHFWKLRREIAVLCIQRSSSLRAMCIRWMDAICKTKGIVKNEKDLLEWERSDLVYHSFLTPPLLISAWGQQFQVAQLHCGQYREQLLKTKNSIKQISGSASNLISFWFVGLIVVLSAGLWNNYWTGVEVDWWKGVARAKDKPISLWTHRAGTRIVLCAVLR